MNNVDTPKQLHPINTDDFPILSREIDGMPINYLDNAATTLKPQCVIDAITKYYSEVGANIHRGKHFLSEEASVHFEESRHKIAQFLGCSGNEIVFVKNTTEAINTVVNGLCLTKDDYLLSTLDAHHSNFLPWLNAGNLELVRINDDGKINLNHYEKLLKKKPKVVALTHCSNITGIYVPLESMIKMAKEQGALVIVDAAQSAPHRKINLKELGADFIVCSAHKMLGPTGIGVLCGRFSELEKLKPTLLGGGMVDWVELSHFRKRKLPHRLEAGTPHIAGVYGWAAAIDYMQSTDMKRITEHDLELGTLMLNHASQRDYIKIVGNSQDAERAGLISIYLSNYDDMGEIARMMSDSYGIMCRSGHLCSQQFLASQSVGQVLRASAYIYNSEKDIESFFNALDDIYNII